MTDKTDLIREIHEYVTTHGGENTATHLLVQAASAIQAQAAELEVVGAAGVQALSAAPAEAAYAAYAARKLRDEIQRLAMFADQATRMDQRTMRDNLETLAEELTNMLAASPTPPAEQQALIALPASYQSSVLISGDEGCEVTFNFASGDEVDVEAWLIAVTEQAAPKAAPGEPSDAGTILAKVCDLFQIGKLARTESTILTNVENTIRFSNMLGAVERDLFQQPDLPEDDDPYAEVDDNLPTPNKWGAKDEADYVSQFKAALLARGFAAPQQEARPCHVFTVRKAGGLTEWEPTTMALALPDGAHALYTLPQPPPHAQADSVTAPAQQGKWAWVPVEPSTAMLVAGNHGQPGDFSALKVWQDMIAALDCSADYTRPIDPPFVTIEPVGTPLGMYEHKCQNVTGHRGPSFVCQKTGQAVSQNSYCNNCPKAAPQQEAQADSQPVPAVDKCTKQQMTTEVLRRMQQQEDGHNKNPFRSLLDRLMRNEGGYSTIEIGQLKYALDGFYGAAYAMPQQEAQEPAATVIKKGADRQWVSERLGALPDGIYSLYLAPQPAPAPAPPATPDGDELRKIARAARTSASDDASPTEYVLAGWRAALAAHGGKDAV